MIELVLYDLEKITHVDCVFYALNRRLGLCVLNQDLCFSYENAQCDKDKTSAYSTLHYLHELGILVFSDIETLEFFVDSTWPKGFRLAQDFQDLGLGKFHLDSVMGLSYCRKLAYSPTYLKCLEEWSEFLLDSGDFIAEKMTCCYFEGFGVVECLSKEYTSVQSMLNALLYLFLFNEIYYSANLILDSKGFCERVLEDLNLHFSVKPTVMLSAVVQGQIHHINDFKHINNIMDSIAEDPTITNILSNHADAKYYPVEGYSLCGNHREFDLIIEAEETLLEADVQGILTEIINDLQENYGYGYTLIGKTTQLSSPINVGLSSIVKLLNFKSLNSGNSYIAKLSFSIFIN